MKRFAIIAFCILQTIISLNAEGHYTIIGPGTLHPEHKYNVAVAVHQTTEPCQLKVGITGPSYNETKVVDVKEGTLNTIEFDVPALEQGDYNLTAEGVTGIIFKNTTKLNIGDFKPNVAIQTDKGIYKPGDVVNFRVLFLDENLRPAALHNNTEIWFEDSKRNIIKQFKNIKVVKGVYSGKFKIAEYPLLGSWHISVKSEDSFPTQAYFKVDKYVLPKYTVKVEATEKVSVRDGDMHVVVRANYTYGEPVNAKVTLVMSLSSYHHHEGNKEKPKEPPTFIKTADMVNGKAKFDLNIKEYEAYMKEQTSSRYMSVVATVEEHFTGIKINGTTHTTVYPYRYHMECRGYHTCGTFEADKESDVVIAVNLVDGTPLTDTKSVVKLTYTEAIRKEYFWRGANNEIPEPAEPKIEGHQYSFESHLNASSVAVFKVKLPELAEFEGYSHYYKVEVHYADEEREVFSTHQYRKPKHIVTETSEEPKDYFKVNTHYAEKKFSVNLTEKAIVTVNSSEPLSYFVYHIVGRGNILHSESVSLPDHPKVYNLTVTPTFIMSPHAQIYIYYVNDAGNLTFAETSIRVEVELQNKIDITATEKVKPGADVALRIKTAPNSFVGLTAVDQSVLLLRSSNTIQESTFKWRLSRFGTRTPWQGGHSTYPGDRSGVVTLTNANYFYNKTSPYGNDDQPINEIAHRSTPLGGVSKKSYHSRVVQTNIQGVSGLAGADNAGNDIAVRKDFSETWIFADIENTETDEFTWTKKIPDSITSWVLTGFSINPIKGLGVTKDSTKIITFQPFFIAIRLPYSVKRGEVISVPALVFNYLEKDLDVEVTLENTDNEFEFTEVSNEVIDEPKQTQTVRVPANSAQGVSFMLRPKIVGNMMLKFTAISPVAGDAVHKTLKVVPEGVTEYANRAYFVNLKKQPDFKETFELDLPKDVVPDSEHIEFSVVGDMLGPILNNLNNLVRMPLGCGEQVVSAMNPNLLVLRYLKSTDKLTPAIETKLLHNLERGYQHILRYAHKDGSFSLFGPSNDEKKPRNGSTWLTAYVVRSLNQAREFIPVNEKIIQDGLTFLSTRLAKNGSFIEHGELFYSPQRELLSLTASVVLAFQEYDKYSPSFQTHVAQGFKYILENLEKTDDLLARAFATYVLHQAKHETVPQHLASLKSLVKSEDDRMWWTYSETIKHEWIWWRFHISHDVELTSYMLILLLDQEAETVDTVLPIVKWLVGQRNSYGGFSSTRDTVVGLEALMKFSKKFDYEPAVMDIEFTSKGAQQKQETVKVTEDNALVMQINELPAKTLSVDFTAKGKGTSLVQIAYQYNILETDKKPIFTINNIINKETPAHKLEMDVCVDYTGEDGSSNMAVLEVSLPSGYVVDEESFERINKVERVRQVETKNGESVLVVYFESLHKGEIQCLPVEAFKAFSVALQKPASIVVYDYYDATKRSTSYYEIESKLCDLCDNDDECKKKCK